ncbi:MAG: hypothetical protein GQE15_03500 [Archangiaceae bacterium]|nr:hypothetical protein [Archangiaceae bacterium]
MKKLEGLGYQRELPEPVLRGLQSNPKDEQVMSVFADELQTRGGPIGTLAALSGNRKRDGMGAFIEQNARALLGPAVEDVELGRVRELSWSWGFLYGVAIDELAEEESDTVATVEELIGRLAEAPVATALRDVTLFPTGVPWSEAVKRLSRLSHPEVLAAIRLDGSGFTRWDEHDAGDFRGVWSRFPALRDLELFGTSMQQGDLESLPLRRLSRLGGGISERDLKTLAKLDQLEALELGFGRGSEEETDRHLLALLPRLGDLRHLALRDLELTERFCERLLELPMWKQLQSVDLSDCWVDDESTARFLGEERTAYRHLERLAGPFMLEASDEPDFEPDEDDERERIPVLDALPNLVNSAWRAAR